MAGSTYGKILTMTTWGESHGAGVGVVVDGCPAGLALCEEDVQRYLDRRKPGQSRFTTKRSESDTVEILSGVFEGRTTGTPISMLVRNQDQHSKDYSEIASYYRPGHADYTFDEKYGFRDYRGGGRSSGRETIGRKGLGSVAERTFRPHVSCAERTPDGRFLLVADLGIDQVKIYRFDGEKGTLSLVDAIRCDLESGPRHFMFSKDGKFLYLMYEIKNVIDVYTYETGDRVPKIEKIQTIPSTAPERTSQLTAACTIRMSEDETHLFCSNAGDNSVSVYERDAQTGLLKLLCCLPISGDYPKDIAIFPDGNHLASINHGSNSISFFQVEYKEKLLVMSGRSISVNEPNCCVITKVPTRGKKAD